MAAIRAFVASSECSSLTRRISATGSEPVPTRLGISRFTSMGCICRWVNVNNLCRVWSAGGLWGLKHFLFLFVRRSDIFCIDLTAHFPISHTRYCLPSYRLQSYRLPDICRRNWISVSEATVSIILYSCSSVSCFRTVFSGWVGSVESRRPAGRHLKPADSRTCGWN